MRLIGLAVIVIWLALIAAGFTAVLSYRNAPAPTRDAVSLWPTDSALVREPGCWRLVVGIHPRCSCSHATLDELARLLPECPAELRGTVLVWRPRDGGPEWDETAVVRRARAIPGVDIVADIDGIEAARFGMRASGHVSLYDAHGTLFFSGGVTNTRGHAGRSIGNQAIFALTAGNEKTSKVTPVYGCSLKGR